MNCAIRKKLPCKSQIVQFFPFGVGGWDAQGSTPNSGGPPGSHVIAHEAVNGVKLPGLCRVSASQARPGAWYRELSS